MAADTKTAPARGTPAKQRPAFEHDHELHVSRFSPCGKFLFGASYDGNIYRWTLEDQTKTAFPAHRGWLQGVVFHPDGKRMYTGDSWGGLCCWNYAEAPTPVWTRTDGHSRWMRSVAISPDGTTLATCGADRVVRLWDAADGSPVWESPPQADDLMCVAFHPGGKSLVVGDLKGVAAEWDLTAHKIARRLDAKALYLRPAVNGVPEINDVGGIRSLAFDAQGTTLACAGSQPATSGFFTGKPTIVLLDWMTGGRTQLLQWENVDPAEGITLDVGWHAAGYWVACSSGQPGKGAFYCWRPGEKSPFHLDKAMAHCRSASTHPDGRRIAVTQVAPRPGQSGGNGRKLGKDSEYLGLVSQIRLLDVDTL